MPLPLYGFVEGDTVGVLIVADEAETVASLKQKVRDAVSLRVATTDDMEIIYRAVALDPAITLNEARFAPLERFDLRKKHGISENRGLG